MRPATAEGLAERHGPAYRWYVTGTVMLGCISMVLSATIVNVALPDIMGEFGMGQDKAQWLSTAFLAAMTATMLTTAWMLAVFAISGRWCCSSRGRCWGRCPPTTTC